MREAATFLFAFLGKRENAPITGSFLLLLFMAWWNMKQNTDHYAERREWSRALFIKDSVSRVEREQFISRIIDLRRDVLDCKTAMERMQAQAERLETEIKILKQKK